MALKEHEYVNGNKMRFESGHGAFDRQTNYISNGNVIANTELGWHIRPHSELRCNGYDFAPGELQHADLKPFRSLTLFRGLKEAVCKIADKYGGCWLYQFFHYNYGGAIRTTHGYIVTVGSGGHNSEDQLKLVVHTGPTYKSNLVLREAARYVAADADDDAVYNRATRVHWRL